MAAKQEKSDFAAQQRQFNEAIRSGDLRRVYLLCGEQAYLRLQNRDKLVKALMGDGDSMNLSRYSGSDISSRELIEMAQTLPFFADLRVIVLENTGLLNPKAASKSVTGSKSSAGIAEEPDKIAEENMEEPALNPIVKPEMTDKPTEDIAPGFPGYEAEYSVHPEGPFDGPSEVDLPEFNKNVERDITVKVTWDVPDPAVGDTAHFKAVLTGYDDLEYTMQWQYSSDRETWYDIPDETTEKMDVAVTEENNVVYWRVLVFIEESRIK